MSDWRNWVYVDERYDMSDKFVSHDHAVGREAMAMACKAVDAARATRPDPTAKKASFLLGWDAALAAVEKELLK